MAGLFDDFGRFERTGTVNTDGSRAAGGAGLFDGFDAFEKSLARPRPAAPAPKPAPQRGLGDVMGDYGMAVSRGVAQGLSGMGQAATFLGGMPVAALIDTVRGGHDAADAVGRAVDSIGRFQQDVGYAPDASTGERVTQQVASFVPDLATMMFSGGATGIARAGAGTATRGALARGAGIAGRALERSARASIIPAASHAGQTAQDVIEAGGTPAQAGEAAAISALTDVAANAVPLSVPGGLLKRSATGAAAGVGAELAQNAALNTVLPEGAKRESTGEGLAVNAGVQALMAALLGPRAGQSMWGEAAPRHKPGPVPEPAPMQRAAKPPSPAPPPPAPPAAAPVRGGATRPQLIEAWRGARTPDEKAAAAAAIAAFDAAKTAPAMATTPARPEDLGDLLGPTAQRTDPTPPAPPPPPPPAGAPLRIDDGLTLQNRDRSRVASVAQMQAIARNPDPERLGFSRDPNTGAPMASTPGGQLPEGAARGREDYVKLADGRRIPVRYAVIEADAVQASHDADGAVNPAYAGAALRALNNGRTAGLQAAWRAGRAGNYRQGILADAATHGVDPQAVAGMRSPVLVRVYDRAHDAGDMAAASNASAQLGLSPVERATTDARALPALDGLSLGEDGSILPTANRGFFRAWFHSLGPNEAAQMVDARGEPNAAALQRLHAAVIARAYGDDRLLSAMVEDLNPESRNVLSAMRMAAPALARLERSGPLGNLPRVVADAFELLREAARRGLRLDEFIAQRDLFGRNTQAESVARFYADNARAPRRIADALRAAAGFAERAETGASNESLFGPAPVPAIDDALRYANEQMRAAHGDQARGFDLGSDARRIAEPGGGGRQREGRAGRAAAGAAAGGEGADRGGAVEGFGLDGGRAEGPPAEVGRAPESGSLFAPPTPREQLHAEAERRDAARNGTGQPGRTDMLAGGGELFAGPRPEQADLGSIGTLGKEGAHYGNTRPLPDTAQRAGGELPQDAAAGRSFLQPQPGQLDLYFPAQRGDRGDSAARAIRKETLSAVRRELAAGGDASPGGHGGTAPQAAAPGTAGLRQRVRLVRTGEFSSGLPRVRDAADAAHIIAPLRKSPQEQLLLLVVDGDGVPLAVARHSMGSLDASTAVPGLMASTVAAIPDARGVYFAHNHPSGRLEPSAADRQIEQRFAALLKGSGIELRGSIIVVPGSRKFVHFQEGVSDITTAPRGAVEVPRVERQFAKVSTGAGESGTIPLPKGLLESPAQARQAVGRIMDSGTPEGLLLLDNQHRPIGVYPMGTENMAKLRTGDVRTSMVPVLRGLHESNASAAIIFSNDPLELGSMRNLGSALDDAGVRVLDIMYRTGDGIVHSVSESDRGITNSGLTRLDGRPFLSRRDADENVQGSDTGQRGPDGQQAVPETARAAGDGARLPGEGFAHAARAGQTRHSRDLATAINRLLAKEGRTDRVRFREVAADDLPREAQEALDAFGAATGTRTVVFRNLTPEVMDFNGVNLRDGRLFLNERADLPLVTVSGHEFTHQLRRDNPDLYAELEAEILRQGDVRRYASERLAYERNAGRIAPEELTSDAVGDALGDPAFLDRLAKANPGVFRKVADAFMRYLDALLAKMGRVRDLGSNRYLQDVQRFRDTLLDVLRRYEPTHAQPEAGGPASTIDAIVPDWYTPISQQPEAVRGALAREFPEYFTRGWMDARSGVPAPDAKRYGASDAMLGERGFVKGIPAEVMTVQTLVRELAGNRPEGWSRAAESAAEKRIIDVVNEPGGAVLARGGAPAGMTGTPEFRRWFGDSKAVDAQGNPLTVYHGTGSEFWAFDNGRLSGHTGHMTSALGHFFAEDRAKAERYAEKAADYVPADQRVIDAQLSIQNPKRMTLAELQAIDNFDEARALRRRLEGEGYDGIHLPDIGQWVAFEPTQIKSASANRGTFDPENPDMRFSRSAMKSVEANERRGAEAMTRVLLDRADAHRAMYRTGLGWVDFVWGSTGGETAASGAVRHGKGIAHLIDQRMRKDGMTRDEAGRLAQRMVTVIARGREVSRHDVGGSVNARLDHGGYQAVLVRQKGSNTWLLTGFEKAPGGADAIGHASASTHVGPTGNRPDVGAGPDASIPPPDAAGNGPMFSRRAPSEPDLAGDSRTDLARMAASEARRQAEAGRAAVLGHLAARGYRLGAPGWQADTGRWVGARGALHDARVALQDKMLALRDAQQDIERFAGGVLPDAMDAYRLENLMHGRVADRIKAIEHDFTGPLQRRMRNLGVSVAQLEDMLLARHAPERNARIAEINPALPDGGAGISTADAQAVLDGRMAGPYSGKVMDAATRAKLAHLAGMVDRLRADTLQELLDSGQITQQLHDALLNTYHYYVPLRGRGDDLDADLGRGAGTGRGASATRQNLRRALGRGEGNLPGDILGELIGDAQRVALGAEKARVGRALLRLASEHPNEAAWTVEPADLEWKFNETTGEAYLGPRNRAEDMDRTLLVNEGGTLYRVRFNDARLARAVLNLGARDLNALSRVLGPVMRYLSATLTSYNPGFVPVNMVRDLGLGLSGLAAEHGHAVMADALRAYPAAMRAAFRDFRHRAGDADVPDARKSMEDWAREFAEAGGQTGIAVIPDVESIGRDLARGAQDWRTLLARGHVLSAAARPLAPVARAVERINVAVENALRLSAYVALRRTGRTREQAAGYAKNITVNFNRKGAFGQAANALYLFFNASVQGAHRVGTLIRDNPGTIGTGMAALAGLQATFALALMDDEDQQGLSTWETIPAWRKQTSLIIPAPWSQDGYFALPLPYGFNWFGYAGGRIAQAAAGRDRERASVVVDLAQGAVRAFSPLPLDEGLQGAAPFVVAKAMQLAGNRDDLGRPIAKDGGFDRFDVPKAATGRADTPQVYRQAAWALNRIGGGDDFTPPVYMSSLTDVAPEQLEWLVTTALGGLGGTASRGLRFGEGLRAGSFRGVADALSQAPVVSSFGIEGNRKAAVAQDFYGQRDAFERGLARLRAAWVADGVDGFRAERARLGAGFAGVKLARYTGLSRDGSKVPGDVRVTSAGSPVLAAAPGSIFEAHRDAVAAAGGMTRAIQRLRGDDPMTVGEVIALAAGDGNRRKAAEAIEAAELPRSGQADAVLRRRALDYLQQRRQELQGHYLQRARDDRRGLIQRGGKAA